MSETKYVQLDIETLSTRVANCPVVQIAAVLATPEEDPYYYPRYDAKIDFEMEHVDKSTLAWHMGQSNEVSKSLFAKNRHCVDLQRAMVELLDWAVQHDARNLEWWCKGANFDFPILEEAAKRLQGDLKVPTSVPWKYYNTRDERTLIAMAKKLHPEIPLPERCETTYPKHDALYDCMYQCVVHNHCVDLLE